MEGKGKGVEGTAQVCRVHAATAEVGHLRRAGEGPEFERARARIR